MSLDSEFGSIAVIIVTYNPEYQIVKTISKLHKQVEKIFIIDNASYEDVYEYLTQLGNIPTISIHYNKKNLGLAAAQNIGMKEAIKQGFDWILFLDQDSYFKEDALENLKKYYLSLKLIEREKVAILCPRVFDTNINQFYSHLVKKWKIFFKKIQCKNTSGIKDVLFAISSGSLIKTDVIKKIGLFRSDFFIDFIDVEFSLRAITNGYTIHAVCNSTLYHKLGNRKVYRLGNFEIRPMFHPPMRKFYMYRNRKKVWKIYFLKVPSYVLYDFLASIYDIIRIMLFEDQKKEKIMMALKGLCE